MSYRPLYLQLNRSFASRAALITVSDEERRLDHALLTFIVNLATISHFAKAAAAYLGMKVLDQVTKEALDHAQAGLQTFIQDLQARMKRERVEPSAAAKESDQLVAQADQAFEPVFTMLPGAEPRVWERTLRAGRNAAYDYLSNELNIPPSDAAFLAQAVEHELRLALKSGKNA